MCLLGKDGPLELLHIHHADVVLDPTWCTPAHGFLLPGPLFGSPVVKPSLKAEDRKRVSELSTCMERVASSGHIICHCRSNHTAEGAAFKMLSPAGQKHEGCVWCWMTWLGSLEPDLLHRKRKRVAGTMTL